jgi:hypothetical protein
MSEILLVKMQNQIVRRLVSTYNITFGQFADILPSYQNIGVANKSGYLVLSPSTTPLRMLKLHKYTLEKREDVIRHRIAHC